MLAGVACLLLLATALGTWNPWQSRYLAWVAHPVLLGRAVAFLLGLAGLAAWRRVLPRLVAGLAVAFGLLVMMLATAWHALSGESVVDRVVSPDGRYELVATRWSATIDDAYDVKLRSRRGLLSREVLVWRDVDRLEQPALRFLDGHRVEISSPSSDGEEQEAERYVSGFDPRTLQVAPVHCLSPRYC
ncbi:MAG: hypothetical protein M3P96_08460 [Actinomycetota bacterium]|nr:hypothetical protein [Actinomycetota bacterium]